jgi:hypothetical protein
MSSFAFEAKSVATAHPGGEFHLVGFADFDANTYFMLQRAFEFNEQDVALGMDTYYIEWCGQEHSGYGGISQFVLKQGSASGSLHSSPTLPQQSSLVEIWRSESVIQVFIDFWLSYGEREMPYLHLGSGTPPRVRTWLIIFDIVKVDNHRLLLFSLFF